MTIERLDSLQNVGQIISFICMMTHRWPKGTNGDPGVKEHTALHDEAERRLGDALAHYGAVVHAGHVYLGATPTRTGMFTRVSVREAAGCPWPLAQEPPPGKVAGSLPASKF